MGFLCQTLVTGIDLPAIETTAGRLTAGAAVVCPGDDFLGLYAERLASHHLQRCALQMMRITFDGSTARGAEGPTPRLGAAVMSDPGLVRYPGYADLPAPDVALSTAHR